MVADLAQLHQRGQDVHEVEVGALRGVEQLFLHHVDDLEVELFLHGVHPAPGNLFLFVRKFQQHLFLGAAQQEGRHRAFELHGACFGLFQEFLFEALEAAQITRDEEVVDRPEFGEVVFHRGAGEGQSVAGGELFDGVGAFGGNVFDVLRLVQDYPFKFFFLEGRDVVQHHRVRDDEELRVRVAQQLQPFGLAAFHDQVGDVGVELLYLRRPVVEQRFGTDHQALAVLRGPVDEGQRLDGFSQAHFVGEDSPQAVVLQHPDPGHSRFLVAAEDGLQISWKNHLAFKMAAHEVAGKAVQPFVAQHAESRVFQHVALVIGQVHQPGAVNLVRQFFAARQQTLGFAEDLRIGNEDDASVSGMEEILFRFEEAPQFLMGKV